MSDIMTFYLILMIGVLAISILVYPTMAERAKKKNKKKK